MAKSPYSHVQGIFLRQVNCSQHASYLAKVSTSEVIRELMPSLELPAQVQWSLRAAMWKLGQYNRCGYIQSPLYINVKTAPSDHLEWGGVHKSWLLLCTVEMSHYCGVLVGGLREETWNAPLKTIRKKCSENWKIRGKRKVQQCKWNFEEEKCDEGWKCNFPHINCRILDLELRGPEVNDLMRKGWSCLIFIIVSPNSQSSWCRMFFSLLMLG